MGYLEVAHLRHVLPDGRVLLDDVSFRVGEGANVALVGANGTGKTTLLRLVAGELTPAAGSVTSTGGVGVMRQFIGSLRDGSTVRDLLLSLAPEALREAGQQLDAAELAMMGSEDDATSMRYAIALVEWGEAGGYEAEVLWDTCTMAAVGVPYQQAQHRMVRTLSGGEQKRLAVEALLRGPDEVLLLDEPDNYLDVPGKRWLEAALAASPKSVLYVSHDRELLARTATRVVTLEAHTAWVHGGGLEGYAAARQARRERLEELHRRWDEEHERLRQLMFTLRQQARISPDMASRYSAMRSRLERFEAAGPPAEIPREQAVTMRLRGGRTGLRAVTAERLGLPGLVAPFDLEVFYGERVALLGANGSGKSHLLRLLAGEPVTHTGSLRLGARVVPGLFAQTHARPDLVDGTLVEVLWQLGHGARGDVMAPLRRYELHEQADQSFATLSGGQQARLQILLLELSGATLLLLDEPTDNLDLHSAEALESGLAAYEGTVIAVTHDRWFARSFDRYLLVAEDGSLREVPEPVWGAAENAAVAGRRGR